jgi:hypothetical protein
VVYADDEQIDIRGAVDVGGSSAGAGRKDDHGNVVGEGHSRGIVVVAEMVVLPFCPR